MDELVGLVLEKLREDDKPLDTVLLASWSNGYNRLNLLVQPVTRNGRLSYNILRSMWSKGFHERDWRVLTDAHYAAQPPFEPVCNFEQIDDVVAYLISAGNMHDSPSKLTNEVHTLAVGKWDTALYRQQGAYRAPPEQIRRWLYLMRCMRSPVPAPSSMPAPAAPAP